MTSKPSLRPPRWSPLPSRFPSAAAELTVGFSQIGSESGWRAARTSVSKSEATKRKVNLKIADAQQKQENQIKAIRSFIAQGVDAIFLAPVVVERLGCGAEGGQGSQDPGGAARSRHRSVGQGRSISPPSPRTACTKARSPANGWRRPSAARPCNVVELQGTVGASVATNRKKGFDSVVAKNAEPRRSCAARPATSPAPRARR